ncbi:MAG: hypothetical protein PHY93_05130 [Bacteriovorax sp.]|nr:hypothetical protein [Bacteriovorax sp.]
MKSLIIFLALSAASTMASTVDSHIFPINGIETEEIFLLNSTQTKTAYRQETVARTCFRTELAGYSNACDYYPEVRCYETRDSARICNSVPIYRCQMVPQYRVAPYACYQTVTTPYEVVDHQVEANFNVKIARAPKEPTDPTSCLVEFAMEGEALRSHADCRKYLILSTEKKTTEVDRAGTVIHNYNVDLKLLDAEATLAPLEGGVAEMHLEGHTLTFRTGDLSRNPNFNLKLFVEKRHLLKSDETLINRNITPGEYTFEKINERFGIVKVNLDKLLGGMNDNKKHVIKVGLNINIEAGTLLNLTSDLKRDATITVNNF